MDPTEDAETPLSSLAEWKDVAPLAQADAPDAVVTIAYEPEFVEAMNYLRAVMATDELSDRVLRLTKRVVRLNPANYTAWHLRRRCLDALGVDLRKELAFASDVAHRTPKNYQIWYHRRALVERLADGSAELDFTASILEMDAKNYHAWSHRQWAVRVFSLWDADMDFVNVMIADDARNNSAWNERWFVLTRADNAAPVDRAVVEAEMDFAVSHARRIPSNECPYNYLRGLAKKHPLGLAAPPLAPLVELADLEGMRGKGKRVLLEQAPLLSFVVDVLPAHGRRAEALIVCEQLAANDAVRAEYWRWRAEALAA